MNSSSFKPLRNYGLIKRNTEATVNTSCVFDDTDDNELQNSPKRKSSFEYGKVKKETKLRIEKALDEDASIFEYDSIYDTFKSDKKSETKSKSARYLPTLLEAAENRKKEQERRLERKIQKEREEEGDEFKDKESFVTTAYKEKLIEMQAENEKEMKEKELEELLDVKKQNDLSGFYRHLLKQQTDETSSKTLDKPMFALKKVNRNIRSRERSSSESSCSSSATSGTELKFEKSTSGANSCEKPESRNKTRSSEVIKETTTKKLEQENMDKITDLISQAEDSNINQETLINKEKYLITLFAKRTVGEIFDEKRRAYLLRKQSSKQV